MNVEYRVLLVGDSEEAALLVIRELQRGGLAVNVERVETAASVQTALQSKPWDFIICDCDLKGFDAREVLALYRQAGLEIPFIMVSGKIGEERAVEMLKAGAHEFVIKDNLARLVPAVNRELRAAQERRIHNQMEATQAFLVSVVESSNDAIFGTTMDGTVLSWNAGAERLYGYTASEMVGRSVTVLIPSFRLGELREIAEKLSRGEPVEHFETVRIRKDGSAVDVSVSVSPIRDGGGRIIGASTVAHDNTRQRQDEIDRLALLRDLTAAMTDKEAQQERPGETPGREG
jgi:PAS domain S-box-containing protein